MTCERTEADYIESCMTLLASTPSTAGVLVMINSFFITKGLRFGSNIVQWLTKLLHIPLDLGDHEFVDKTMKAATASGLSDGSKKRIKSNRDTLQHYLKQWKNPEYSEGMSYTGTTLIECVKHLKFIDFDFHSQTFPLSWSPPTIFIRPMDDAACDLTVACVEQIKQILRNPWITIVDEKGRGGHATVHELHGFMDQTVAMRLSTFDNKEDLQTAAFGDLVQKKLSECSECRGIVPDIYKYYNFQIATTSTYIRVTVMELCAPTPFNVGDLIANKEAFETFMERTSQLFFYAHKILGVTLLDRKLANIVV